MLYHAYQYKLNQTQEVVMNDNIIDGIKASIIFGVLSAGVGLILQAFGFSPQVVLVASAFALLALLLLFIFGRNIYSRYKRKLTVQLLEDALKSDVSNVDEATFKNLVIARVLKENVSVEASESIPITVFPNQLACESQICEAFGKAKKVRILTIRGQEYFLGSRSLFYDLYLSKQRQGQSPTIEVLVLSPEADHITEELARRLGHNSAEQIRIKMRIALEYLKHIADQNRNFTVKCYNETPIFKILLFDDAMFVSSFDERGGRKNDYNAKMWEMTREDNPIFTGLEIHFEKLWERSVPPE